MAEPEHNQDKMPTKSGSLEVNRGEEREASRKSHKKDEEGMRLFCTLFEDYEFDKDTLVQLWIASRFIWGDPKDHIAYSYFENLLSKDHFIYSTTCFPSERKMYKVDVNRLLNGIQNMENKEHHLMLKDLHHSEKYEHVQRLALVGDAIDEDTLNALKKFKDLKTLLLLCNDASNINTIPDDLFSALKHLEVLDLSKTHIKELPDSVENLVNLRYLDLSFTLIELLPETIDCLSKLQTLKLNDCRRLLRLPEGMRKLTFLEHLELDVINQLPFMPRGIGSLTNLQSLSAFLVHKDDGRGIKELRNMNNLKGRFCIKGLENVLYPREAYQAALSKKKNIKELEFRWSDSQKPSWEVVKGDIIFDLLCPSFHLEKLQISCYNGPRYPSWISDPSFDKLTNITLFKCNNIFRSLPLFWKLPSLKCLSLIDLNDQYYSTIPYLWEGREVPIAFPKLERLTIVGLLVLALWSRDKKVDFPNLSEFIVERCHLLESLPSTIVRNSTLKHLEVINCSNLTSFLDDKKLSTSLVTLIIEDCPKINEWIQENKEDWNKNIKHVKNVWTDHDEN